MRVASYRQRIQIILTEDEHKFLGGAGINVKLLNGKGGFIQLEPGDQYKANELTGSSGICKGARFNVFPPHNSLFGSQKVETAKVGNTLIGGMPDITKPVRKIHFKRGRRLQRMPSTIMAAEQVQVARAKAAAANTNMPLDQGVGAVNASKAVLGDQMVLSVTPEGFLEVLIRYGR